MNADPVGRCTEASEGRFGLPYLAKIPIDVGEIFVEQQVCNGLVLKVTDLVDEQAGAFVVRLLEMAAQPAARFLDRPAQTRIKRIRVPGRYRGSSW